jgi:hypothetical protein
MSVGAENEAVECLSCGARISSTYCSACGEKRVGSHALQLGHLAHDFWHEITHLDGRIWRSFRALLFQPGLLTQQYWEGRYGRWLRPLRLFLIVTALSLLLVPDTAGPLGIRPFLVHDQASTRIVFSQRPTSNTWERGLGDITLRVDSVIPDDISRLNSRIHKFYKFLQYLGLAFFAAFSLLLLRRVQPYYGGHLIWALHFYSFEYVITGVASKLNTNAMFGWLLTLGYLIVALRRLGGSSWWRAILKAFALCLVMLITELLLMVVALRLGLE